MTLSADPDTVARIAEARAAGGVAAAAAEPMPPPPFIDAMHALGFELVRERILARALSAHGRDRVKDLVPSPVYAEVHDELARVGEFLSLLEADDPPPLGELDDIRPSLHRMGIAGSVIQAEDWRPILHVLVRAREYAAFMKRRSDRCPMLAGMVEMLLVDKTLEYHIDRVIDEEGGVRDSASKELRAIRRDIIERSAQLRRRMDGILKRVSEDAIVQDDLVTMRDGRMVLPVKSEYKRSIQGFIHGSSATGQTVYIEPMETLELNNEIRDLQFAELREISAILGELTDRVRTSAAALLETASTLAECDCIRARAVYARDMGGVVPGLRVKGPLELYGARHPLLLAVKRREQVVPLDLTLGPDVTTMVITGPNAGGKSVAMKTVGLLALMAQSGIPIPCASESRLPVYTGISVDIGDEQSVENDLSTFSSHIRRLAVIVEQTDARSLVLIDEIGTGTDPSEGSALGAAILEELTARGAHVIATTHHGMLKAFAHEHPAMMNAAMEFDMTTLQPTYRFRAGQPGSSYAFEITRRHGLRPALIDRARELLGTRSDALEKLLADVERNAQELASRIREAETSAEKQKRLATEYRAKLDALKMEAREVRKDAAAEAERIVRDAKALIEQTIRELREEQASKDAIRAAHRNVDRRLADLRELVADSPATVTSQSGEESAQVGRSPIRTGDAVSILTNPGVIGTALEHERDGSVTVAFGAVRMRVAVTDLIRHERREETARSVGPVLEHDTKNEIDVRGMYGDEAVRVLDTYLYDAYAAGFGRVDIIHGKGTGALRKRVHELLRSIPFVESFRLGEWNEGSAGVTVAFLKQ